MVLSSCFATIGSLSNSENNLQKSGKAGRSRWLGEDQEQEVLLEPC